MYICIYIYIYRERERDLYIYIYIYTYAGLVVSSIEEWVDLHQDSFSRVDATRLLEVIVSVD